MDVDAPHGYTRVPERALGGLALLVVANVVLTSAAQESLFLAHHPRSRIPVAMLAGSLVAALGALAAAALLRRASAAAVLRGTLFALAAGTVAMAAWNRAPSAVSTFGLFLFIELAATVGTAILWTYIQAPIDPAGARRLLPRLNAYASVGAVLAGLALPIALRGATPQALLVPAAALWLAALPLVRTLATPPVPRSRRARTAAGLAELARRPLARWMAIGTAGVLWMALAVQFETRVALQANLDAAGIAGAMGRLLAVAAVAGLATQVLLTRPLLERWGIGAALAALPVSLVILLGAHAVWPSLWTIAGAFLADRVFRQTLHRSSESCLVAALPPRARAAYLMAFGGVVAPLLKAAGSLAILGLAGRPGWVLGSALLVAATLASLCLRWRRLYVRTLRQTIEDGALGTSGPPDLPDLLDGPKLEMLLDSIDRGTPRSRRLALEWLRPQRETAVRRGMTDRLTSPEEAVRVLALRWLSDEPPTAETQALLAARWRDPSLSEPERIAVMQAAGRAAAALFGPDLARLAGGASSSLRTAATRALWGSGEEGHREAARRSASGLLASASSADRTLGLRLVQEAGDASSIADVLPLSADPDPSVRRAAISCLGRLPGPEARSVVWAAIDHAATAATAAMAIASRGEEGLLEVHGELASHASRPAVRVHLLRALRRIASPASVPSLLACLDHTDQVVRAESLRALNRIHAQDASVRPDPERVRAYVVGEVGHGLRLLRAREGLGRHIHARGLLARELATQIDGARERASRGLGLLSPPGAMAEVFRAVRTGSSEGGQARELLRTLFPGGPLRDGALRLLDDAAVWTEEHERPPLLARPLASPRAAMEWIEANGDRTLVSAARHDPQARTFLDIDRREEDPMEPMVDTLLFLTDVGLFEGLTDGQLLEVARLAEPVEVAAGEALFRAREASECLFVIRQGKVAVKAGGEERARLGPGECVGEIGVLAGNERSATVEAIEPCRLLRFDGEDFLALLDAYPEIGRGLLKSIVRRFARASGNSDSLGTMIGMIGGPEETPSLGRM